MPAKDRVSYFYDGELLLRVCIFSPRGSISPLCFDFSGCVRSLDPCACSALRKFCGGEGFFEGDFVGFFVRGRGLWSWTLVLSEESFICSHFEALEGFLGLESEERRN